MKAVKIIVFLHHSQGTLSKYGHTHPLLCCEGFHDLLQMLPRHHFFHCWQCENSENISGGKTVKGVTPDYFGAERVWLASPKDLLIHLDLVARGLSLVPLLSSPAPQPPSPQQKERPDSLWESTCCLLAGKDNVIRFQTREEQMERWPLVNSKYESYCQDDVSL